MGFLQVTPYFDENAVTGAVPGAFLGVDLPDGDAADWHVAPIGTIYVYKPNELTNPRYFVKRQGESRDDDWGALGGLHVVQARVELADFTDGGAAAGTVVLSETIPVGAWVQQAILKNVTGFTGDTSATITVGDGTDVDRYNTGTPSVFTTANAIDLGVPSGTKIHTAAGTVTVTVTSATDFTAVTAGAFTILISYLY